MATYERIYTSRLSIFSPIKEMKKYLDLCIDVITNYDIENINSMFLKTK